MIAQYLNSNGDYKHNIWSFDFNNNTVNNDYFKVKQWNCNTGTEEIKIMDW